MMRENYRAGNGKLTGCPLEAFAGLIPVMGTLKDRIEARLEALGLTARGASLQAGLGADTIRNVQRGKSENLQSSKISALAKVLQCSVQYLLTGADQPSEMPAGADLPQSEASRIATAQGTRLRYLRSRFDSGSYVRAAEIAGVTPGEWLMMEDGRERIDIVALYRFCEHHSIGPSYVVSGTLDALPGSLARDLVHQELAEMVAEGRRASGSPAERQDSSEQIHSLGTATKPSLAE